MKKIIQTLLLATLLPSCSLAQVVVTRLIEATIPVAEDQAFYTYYHTSRPVAPLEASANAQAQYELAREQWENERWAAQQRILAQEIKFLADVESRGTIHIVVSPRLRIGGTEYFLQKGGGSGEAACQLVGAAIGKEDMRSVVVEGVSASGRNAQLFSYEAAVYLRSISEYRSPLADISQIVCVE